MRLYVCVLLKNTVIIIKLFTREVCAFYTKIGSLFFNAGIEISNVSWLKLVAFEEKIGEKNFITGRKPD